MAKNNHIIVIGASAGGISAIAKLTASLPRSLEASVFIVIHLAKQSRAEIILALLQKHTSLNCVIPADEELIRPGNIYLAPTDQHMILTDDKILIRRGPRENHWRPAIDVLFRSAAANYGGCVTGVILTGMMDDGTSGMVAIKKVGGTVIVQDPLEAEFNDMPNNVIKQIKVDHIARLEEITSILVDRCSQVCKIDGIPHDVKLETEITVRMNSDVKELEQLATPTTLTCPDCGGVLMEIKEKNLVRYRCYTGHSFNENSLEILQSQGIENSIWVAIRMMEERRNLLSNMELNESSNKNERIVELEVHIERLKQMLLEMGNYKAIGSKKNKQSFP